MTEPRFDPGGFYQFDLARGAVRTREGGRVLILSDAVLSPLVTAAVEKGDLTAVRRLGKHIGEQVLEGLGGANAADASPETVLTHAAGILALFGWGKLGFERWGRALVVAVDHAPTLDDDRLGIAALLGGMLSSLARREVACVPVDGARFVVLDPSIAEKVWAWSRDGVDLAGIVGRLAPSEAA